MANLPQSRPARSRRKRTRSYSIAEAERLAQRLPLQRKFSAIEAAHAVVQFLPADPAFWLEQSGLAGLSVSLIEGRVATMFGVNGDNYDREQADFLQIWLGLTPGGKQAVKALLMARTSA